MTENEHKQKTATEFLDAGEIHVTLDPRQAGVQAPPAFLEQESLILKFSHRYDTAAPIVNEWGIRQVLKFVDQGGHVACAVPWAAVSALVSRPLGLAVPYSAPPEPVKADPKSRGGLRLVS